mgnify:CR=1
MITKAKIKGALLQFKRAPFTCQKGMFCNAKEHLLIYRCEFILHRMLTDRLIDG